MDDKEWKSGPGRSQSINENCASKHCKNITCKYVCSSPSHEQKLGMRVMYINADNGVLNKRQLLMTRIDEDEPDIIIITEALPKNRSVPVEMSELSIEGYDLFSNIPSHSKRGVLIYTRSCI